MLLGLEPGSIIIYISDKDTGKDAETKMLSNGSERSFRTLKALAKENEFQTTVGSYMATLENLYSSLWNFRIFIEKKYIKDKSNFEDCQEICKEYMERGSIANELIIRIRELEKIEGVELGEIKEIKKEINEIIALKRDPRETENLRIKNIIVSTIRKYSKEKK